MDGLTGRVQAARLQHCVFRETVFPSIKDHFTYDNDDFDDEPNEEEASQRRKKTPHKIHNLRTRECLIVAVTDYSDDDLHDTTGVNRNMKSVPVNDPNELPHQKKSSNVKNTLSASNSPWRNPSFRQGELARKPPIDKYADVLKQQGFITTEEAPTVFFKLSKDGPCITSIYVDDTNAMGTPAAVDCTTQMLKNTFKMKDFGTVTACIGVQIDHLNGGTFLHQTQMVDKILNATNLVDIPTETTPLKVKEDEEAYTYIESYRSIIGMLSYLANTTRPDISFSVNLLARFSNKPSNRHYEGIKHICAYLKGTRDYGLFFRRTTDTTVKVMGYSDAGYLSDSRTTKSQTGYVYTVNGTAFLWHSCKQPLNTTSSYEVELMAMYEACRELTWLMKFSNTMQDTLKEGILHKPIPMYMDNEAAFNNITQGYIRTRANMHIQPKFYKTKEYITQGLMRLNHIPGDDNPADILTKTLPTLAHEKHVAKLGLISQKSLFEAS
ncbi:DNA-directed DNA polymerase [Synchytrium microbalum]|uniref:DNA-directed DNA polymerase n=1 Tax=Synchytrium microbalum TaxID=1806994 RepID=A0A507BY22_9FUNG|nr:DNA-directed DNA polymerase [Synchytrium microbalum]TPX33687.1 DNA-directed DNA polymerase [Synchytrium microbalum]